MRRVGMSGMGRRRWEPVAGRFAASAFFIGSLAFGCAALADLSEDGGRAPIFLLLCVADLCLALVWGSRCGDGGGPGTARRSGRSERWGRSGRSGRRRPWRS